MTYVSYRRLSTKSNYDMEVILDFYLASMHVYMQGTQKHSCKPHRAMFTSTLLELFDEDFVYVSLKGRSTRYGFVSTKLKDFYDFGAKQLREVDEKSFPKRQVLRPNFRNEAEVHSGSGRSFLYSRICGSSKITPRTSNQAFRENDQFDQSRIVYFRNRTNLMQNVRSLLDLKN